MTEREEVISSFMFNPVACRLNKEAGAPPVPGGDDMYAKHKKAELEERSEFLEWAAPAFFAGLRRELINEAEELNRYLIREEDKVKVHISQDTLRDALITSNVADTKWFNDEISLEISSGIGEIVETYRCFNPSVFRENEVSLLADPRGALRIATETRSYAVPEYAHHLIERFLEERQALRDHAHDS